MSLQSCSDGADVAAGSPEATTAPVLPEKCPGAHASHAAVPLLEAAEFLAGEGREGAVDLRRQGLAQSASDGSVSPPGSSIEFYPPHPLHEAEFLSTTQKGLPSGSANPPNQKLSFLLNIGA